MSRIPARGRGDENRATSTTHRRTVLGLIGASATVGLAGCSTIMDNIAYTEGTRVNCSGTTLPGRIDYECDTFDGSHIGRLSADEGETIELEYSVDLNKGTLEFLLRDPDDETIWEVSYTEGDVDDGVETVEAPTSGRYEVRVEGDDAGGAYEIRWGTN